ncbi:glutathione S-transferase family protein [Brevundimonas sp.]|uniref:glutathione S-transferase family protein n=1 Tax=Brevundimonas sp. TaxID=1871086 RepID=UPI001DDE2BDC|nr:glutathione S-transferase family protein [Brevundimonas sp.]MBL0946534.1 glutathione S-transferase family protein [Brevundimonas sp.]
MRPVITAFENSPDRGQGLARDMRVRWALEELGASCDVRLMSFDTLKQPEHLARQPFGQLPTYEDEDVTLFESGSILIYLADRHGGLLPPDPVNRARAITWMFAALNTVEPPVFDRAMLHVLEADKPWFQERLKAVEGLIDKRLASLSACLGERDWLEEGFTGGDLLMATVLMRLKGSALLAAYPNLVAYLARAEARPAFQRAWQAQYATYIAANPM